MKQAFNPRYDRHHIVIGLTSKALRVEQLRSAGMAFNDALKQADQEFSENGWSPRPQHRMDLGAEFNQEVNEDE
jgi:hypothetical protein